MKILNVLRVLAYVYMFTVLDLIIKGIEYFFKHNWFSPDNWIKTFLIMLFFVVVAVLACIAVNTAALKSKGTKTFSIMNLIVKIWYLRIHFIALNLAKDMFIIIWFTLGSWVPVAISLFLLLFSAIANVGTCINLYRNKQCKLSTTIILSIMGFIYGLDIIGGIIQLVLSFKRKNI
ncbi:MAG: hypothetical protein K2J08_06095 [Ruminococcus sp.]|nr:hypothetical protein [Ruminococcus sp.]